MGKYESSNPVTIGAGSEYFQNQQDRLLSMAGMAPNPEGGIVGFGLIAQDLVRLGKRIKEKLQLKK